MNYFSAIAKRASELDDIAQKYLDSLPFIPDPECVQRIYKEALKIFKENNENWNKVPEWVASSVDGYMPFSAPPIPGSMYVSLGHSPVARSANLRMLLEYAEGRRNNLEYFTTLAEEEIVEKYADSK